MAVQKVLRVAAAVLAVGLVGYAVVLASRPDTEDAGTKAGAERARSTKAKPGGRDPSGADDGPVDPTDRRARAASAARAAAGSSPPTPVPTQPIDYEKSYSDFDKFIGDLETMAAQGQSLPQPEWAERYRRGNEMLDTLMRAPEAKVEGERKELSALNLRFRDVIMKVLAKPSPQ